MKKIIRFSNVLLVVTMLASACQKESGPDPKKPEPNNPPDSAKVSYGDTLIRTWEVVEAYHEGAPDNSSVGLVLEIKSGGSYVLHSTGYQGTWRLFEEDTKVWKVVLDEATPQYKTTWALVKCTTKELEVAFQSPFTGGKSSWIMKPKK